jgi:hypothetical protein
MLCIPYPTIFTKAGNEISAPGPMASPNKRLRGGPEEGDEESPRKKRNPPPSRDSGGKSNESYTPSDDEQRNPEEAYTDTESQDGQGEPNRNSALDPKLDGLHVSWDEFFEDLKTLKVDEDSTNDFRNLNKFALEIYDESGKVVKPGAEYVDLLSSEARARVYRRLIYDIRKHLLATGKYKHAELVKKGLKAEIPGEGDEEEVGEAMKAIGMKDHEGNDSIPGKCASMVLHIHQHQVLMVL